MKWIVREGRVRGKGRYFSHVAEAACNWSMPHHHTTIKCLSKAGAEATIRDFRLKGRVVRLLSPEEAKAKAKAEVLREVAEHIRKIAEPGEQPVIKATRLEERADALWPRRGGR